MLVPLTVKVTTVIFGYPDRCFAHQAYQVEPDPKLCSKG